MEVTALIEKIQQVPALKNALHQMIAAHNGALNLVRPDWKEALNNNITFQDYQSGKLKFRGSYKRGDSWTTEYMPGNGFDVIIPGTFTFFTNPKEPEKTSISCENSDILSEITKGFTQTVRAPHTLSDSNFRFFGEDCNPVACKACRDAIELHGKYLKSPRQWCILRTKIFDGERVRNCFREQVAQSSNCTFSGFVALRIKSRYYSENEDKMIVYKVGGHLRDMVLFKEDSLSVEANDVELDIIPLNMYLSKRTDDIAYTAIIPELVEPRDSTSVAEEMLVELFNQPKRTLEGGEEVTGTAKKQKVEDLVTSGFGTVDSNPIEAIPRHLQETARNLENVDNEWKLETSHEKLI